jgi:hypothetical protein
MTTKLNEIMIKSSDRMPNHHEKEDWHAQVDYNQSAIATANEHSFLTGETKFIVGGYKVELDKPVTKIVFFNSDLSWGDTHYNEITLEQYQKRKVLIY